MESDDDGPPTGLQPLWKNRRECGLEVFEFAVDGNPQRLKHACCGVGVSSPAAGGKGLCDGVNKFRGRP